MVTININTCVICNELLQDKVIGIILDTNPNFDRKRDSTLGGFFTTNKPEFLATGVCNSATCLKSLLERLANNLTSLSKSLQKTNIVPGSWFGPSGCQHYIKGVYRTKKGMLDWYDYANDLDEEHMNQAEQEIRIRLSRIFNQTEAKPASVSLVGGYGHLFDGWLHFCDAHCAVVSLFGNPDNDLMFFANELSHNTPPALTV